MNFAKKKGVRNGHPSFYLIFAEDPVNYGKDSVQNANVIDPGQNGSYESTVFLW